MPMTAEDVKYKRELLYHFIEAALDAIKRARATWLLGVIIVFVFGVSVFNATFSWNDEQIERRAKLYSAAVKGNDAVKSLLQTEPAIGNALNAGIGELGYLQAPWGAAKEKQAALEAFKASGNKDEDDKSKKKLEDEARAALAELKSAAFSDLHALIDRRNAFDTVSIPFIGVSVTGSDYGIVGGFALIIVGYWLMAMLRREHLILGEFVRINNDGHLIRGSSNYDPGDLIYACHRIKHYMVFSIPEPDSRLSYVTTASFFAAPFLLILNHVLTIRDVYYKQLGSYQRAHFIAELLIMCIGVAVWITGWLYQYRTMQLMQRWEVESRKNNPFPNE